MITVVVKCRKHPNVCVAEYGVDPEEDEHTVRIDPCERCIDDAEQDGKDSRDDEVAEKDLHIHQLSEQIELLQDELQQYEDMT